MLQQQHTGTDVHELLASATTLDLSHRWFPGMPVAPVHMPYMFSLVRRHGDVPRDDGSCTANEVIIFSGHTGTHIDALGHVSSNGKLAGGLDASATQTGGTGLKDLGVERIGPIVTSGVLLDIARLKGVSCLPPDYEVTPADLEAAEDAAGVRAGSGDAVVIRTGWASRWPDPESFINAGGGTPGPGLAAANWLAERQVVATGTDTLTYEIVRPGDNVRPVHARLLVEAGIYLFETLNLEDLAQAGVHSFLFVAAPLKLVGATASPVSPLAIFWPQPEQPGES
jgi:kynurenine formamidase